MLGSSNCAGAKIERSQVRSAGTACFNCGSGRGDQLTTEPLMPNLSYVDPKAARGRGLPAFGFHPATSGRDQASYSSFAQGVVLEANTAGSGCCFLNPSSLPLPLACGDAVSCVQLAPSSGARRGPTSTTIGPLLGLRTDSAATLATDFATPPKPD